MSEQNVLDLTLSETLYELAFEEEELLGRKGAKVLSDMLERAFDAQYTHVIYRDPFRPGRYWCLDLNEITTVNNEDGSEMPGAVRSKIEYSRKVTDELFPDLLPQLESYKKSDWEHGRVMADIPPLNTDLQKNPTSGLELVTGLEYLVFMYPEMVRAWAALIFTYGEILGMYDAAERARQECYSSCRHSQVVVHFLSPGVAEA